MKESLPPKDKICYKYGKKGHFQGVCQSVVLEAASLAYSSDNPNPGGMSCSSKDRHYSDDKTTLLASAPACLSSTLISFIVKGKYVLSLRASEII